MNVCVMDSPELKELYNSVKETGESYESIKNLVNVWQLRKFNRNKNFDFTELPTKQDIENLLKERNVPNIDSVFVQEYSQEMKNILAKAPRDSQGRLLAPNGKPSNLTERQYAQVRTKAFKEWFGDWENDPANASKVVDENGEPLVVYHGTTQDFTTFSKDKLGSFTHAASAKLAFFATSNENLAKDIYAELEDNEHFYKRMLAVDPNFSREDLGIVPEDDPKDEIYSEYINNYDNLKYEYKDVIEEANKLITYKSSTKEITISKALEWVEDKDISDYEKEGFIISDKQLADYKEGKEITISKPIKVSDGGTLEERIAKLNTPRSKEYLKELKELENIRDKELIELEEKLKHVYNSKVKALFLNIRNPKIDSDNGHKYRAESYFKRIQKAINNNNDGGIIKDTRDPYLANIYYFFEPNQVKSATDNIGTFSTEDNRIDRFEDTILNENNKLTEEQKQFILNALPNLDTFIEDTYKAVSQEKYKNNPYYQLFLQIIDTLKVNNIPVSIVKDFDIDSIAQIRRTNFKEAIIKVNPKMLFDYLTQFDRNKMKSKTVRVILHELVHSITADVVDSHPSWSEFKGFDEAQSKFNAEIDRLYNITVKEIGSEEWYGLENKAEFIAEALTNQAFQKRLSELKYNKEQTIFERIANSIRDLFYRLFYKHGIDISNSVFEDILKVSQEYLDYAKFGINKNINTYGWGNTINRFEQIKNTTQKQVFSTEDNSIYKHLLHKDIISEKDYIEFLKEFELSREKTDDFLYNFITKILQVNPRNKRDKSIPLTVQNYPTSNKVFIDYRTEGTIINRILGLSGDFSFDSETFEKDLKDYIENKWEKDLYEELIKLDKEKLSTLDFLYKEKVKIQHNISLLQNYLRYRENSSKETLEYIETFKSTKRKTTSLVQHIGYELKKKKSELATLDEKIKHYRFSNASRTLKVKNRLAALYNIDNVKELVFNRIKADRDSYKLPKEEWEKKIAPYMSLYEKAKKASKNAELLEYNNPIFENKKSLDEISVNELYNKLIQLNPEMKSFLEFIKLVNPKLKIKVYNTEDYNNLVEREDSYISGQSASIFFPKKNEVAFRLNADTSTILHELLHSVSSYGLIGSSEEQKALGKNVIQPFIDYIDNYLKQNVGNFGSYSIFGAKMPATIYGLTNPAEFIAELFSNKDFQELLDVIPPMEKKQYSSLLEEIIDSILNFVKNIFAPKTSETALDQAIQLSLAVIRTQYENIDEIYEQLSNIEGTAQKQILDKQETKQWNRYSDNNYEVSSEGDKRFSAKYATFKPNTIIDGVDVGGKTIEDVYQNVIKKSGKGQTPSKDSRLYIPSVSSYTGNITPDANTIFVFGSNPEGRHGAGAAKIAREQFGAIYGRGEGLQGNAYALPTKRIKSITPTKTGQMTFSYGTNKRGDVKSNTTLEAIINGERTATTRYSTDGHIDYWKDLKVGDIVAFTSADRKTTVYVKITKPLTKLDSSTNAEEWSKKEGWSVEYYNSKVKPKVEKGQAYQMEYEFVDANGERTITSLQIIENIKKLYETARQNPNKQFKIAYRNTDKASLNGYTGLEMIDMFLKAGSIPSNIVFSKEWVDTGKFNLSDEAKEDFSYTEGYLPLWQEWAKQNPELIEELREKSKGKVLTDKFANTRVSQARALADILNSTNIQQFQPQQTPIPENLKETPETVAQDINKEEQSNYVKRNVKAEIISQLEEELKDFGTFERRQDRINFILRFIRNQKKAYFKEHQQILQNKINDPSTTERDRKNYQKLLNNLDADEIFANNIDTIINRAKQALSPESVSRTLSRKLLEKGYPDFNTLTEEQQEQKITEDFNYRTQEFAKIQKHWNSLMEDVKSTLRVVDGYVIDFVKSKEDDNKDNQSEGEGTVKDNWMYEARKIDQRESLSKKVKTIINNIPILDRNGKQEIDDLGYPRFMNAEEVTSTLFYELSNARSCEHFWQKLNNLPNKKPWSKIIVDTINKEGNYEIKSQFYQNFRKESIPYWSQIWTKKGKITTKKINRGGKNNQLLEDWKDNIESGTILTPNSIYGENGKPNVEKAAENLKTLGKLVIEFKSKGNKLGNTNNLNTLLDLINSVGIEITTDELTRSIQNYPQKTEKIFNSLHTIFSKVSDNKTILSTTINNVVVYDNIVEKLDTQYNLLATLIDFDVKSIELQSFRELGDTYQSVSAPSYLGTLISNLTNTENEEEFKQFFEKEFGQYTQFKDKETGRIKNEWLSILYNKPEERKNLERKVVLHSNRKEFNKQTPQEYLLGMLVEFIQPDINYAYYALPLLSDADSEEFIKFIRYTDGSVKNERGESISYKSIINEKLAQAIKDEYDRILMVNRRLKSNAETITTFDSRGTKFTYFPELNDITVNADGVINGEGENKLFKDALDYLTNTKQDLLPFISKVMGQIMDANSKEFISDAFNIANVELISEKLNMTKDSVPKLLDNFFYNYALANINMIQLLTTDLAYYKNTIDFFKRFKEVYASTLKLDTTAKFVGENGDEVKGSKTQSVMILKDNIIKSPSYDSIKSILEGRVQAGAITTKQMNDLLEAYSKVNVADAQGYRTLKSYRKLMVMAGRWNKKLERSYQRLKNGTFDFDDFNSIFNTIKPFCYSQRPVASQVVYTNESTNETVEYGNLKVPIQIKDSEVVLLAMYSTLVSPLNNSEKLVGLNKFMDDNDIDIVVFESGVKVGGQGIIDINNVKNTYEALQNTVLTNGEKNPFYIHNISTEDFGIQVETPDHLVDVEQLIGSQIKKLIQGDIDVNNIGVTFRLNEGVKDREKTMNKQEMLSHINKLLSSNIIDSFENLREEFSSLDKVAETLQKELKGNSRYTKDLIVACSLVETTDQIGNVIKEFALPLNDATQFSRIENLLTSLFKNQVIKQKIRGGSPIQFSCYGVSDDLHIEMTGEGTERRIKWVDCYMPAYTKEFFKYYMTTDENGNQFVDINKVPEELKRLVGYRVPTEARYSMLPLRIKGFLPSSEGSKIMVPADITTIAGSDFDVDKLYVLLPTFYTKHTKNGDVLNYVKYDYSKTEQENSKDARNNELISCIFSVLTNEDSADKLLTPGGFDIAKQASYICNIFSAGKKTVEKLFGRKINTEEDAVNLYYELLTYSNKKLGGYNEILNAGKGVTNPITQVKIHDQNATGGALIGIYANHNVAHSMFQNIGNQLEGFAENTKPQLAKTVVFNDKEYKGLTNVKNYEGHLITTNIANFLAASVDNAKDPVLKALMQNNTTANTACLMLRLGIEPITVGLFLNQPIIKEILSLVENGIEIKEAIKVTEEKYEQFAETSSNRNSYKMFDSDLAFNLLFAEQGKDNPKFNNYQFWVLKKFKYLYKAGDYLGRYTNLNKADTQNGAAGPSIAEVINKLTKIYRFNKSINNVKERLVKGKPVSTPIFFLPEIGSKENFIGDATEYSILHIPELLEDYLPYFSDYVSYLINTLADVKNIDNESDVNEISDNSVANVIKELTLFSYSRFVKKPLNYYLNDYLNKFIDLKNKYPELSDNLFFKRLKLTQPLLKKGVQLRLLQFSNAGSLSKLQKEQISKSWEMLNRSDNEEIRTFMNELFDYFFYVGGFNFNAINPSYLTPISVKLENDNYVNSLKNISTLSDYELTLFKEQFILHHLDEFAVDVSQIIPSITLTDKQDKEFKFDINKAPEVFKTIETLPNYIKIIADNKVIYYEYNRDSDIYVHIKPLGLTGKIFEYNIFDNTNKGNLGDIKQNLNLEGLYKDTEEAPKEEASMPNKSDSTELRQQYDANIAAANGSSLEEFGFGTEFVDESKSKKPTNKLDSYNIDTEIKDINDMPICGSM